MLWKTARSKGGNFGLMAALLAAPMVCALGSAIDFGYSYNIRSKLTQAADAAVLGAISESSPGFEAAMKMTADGQVPIGEDDGKRMFFAQQQVAGLVLPSQVAFSVVKSGQSLTSTATFSVPVPTFFMGIFGKTSITVSGTASAVYESGNSNTYADYFMLLDNTPSMGIGATQADIDALIRATANASDGAGRNCAFACHMVWSNSGVENNDSTYLLARQAGVTLRVDVLGKAVQAMIADAGDIQGSKNLFRFAAYNFGKMALEPGYQIGKIIGLTDDIAAVTKATKTLELMTTDHHNYNEDALTSFDTALTRIGDEITIDGGSGATTSDRQEIVFFVTDGVADSLKPSGCTGLYTGSAGRCLEPIDVRYCDRLKARNIKIAIIYTTYTEIDDHLYNTYIKKFASQIGPKLQACATTDLYFEVGPADDMGAAMKKMFVRASSASRLRLAS